jgi:hydantoinase/carbamoylase family amidase
MREARLTVARDAIGNLFGSTDENQPGVSPLAAGSHIDTVPDGGRYDGRLGVVGAIEAIEALRAAGVTPARPLEVIVWRCEEPSRFPAGRIGSQVFGGDLAIEELLPQGESFGLAARLAAEAVVEVPERANGRPLASYLELHIEQGKRLEDAGVQIGVVTAIAAATRVRIDIVGAADHSGATPMGLRHDALCAAAELVLATERAGFARAGEHIVATAVRIAAEPGALNVVPGRVELWLDVRGIEALPIVQTIDQIRADAGQIAAARGVTIALQETAAGTPVRFAPETIAGIDATARALGYTTVQMPSGAGHDAQTVAPLAPAGMIFVPSVAGISHAPTEFTPPEAIERGVRTLAAEWARQALG